jgi:excisionase family DNA binding protein
MSKESPAVIFSMPLDQLLDEITERLKPLVASGSNQTSAIDSEEIIDTSELCKRLAISEPSVIKWRRKKKIPFLRIGSSVRYNWPAVVRAIEK